MHTLFVYVTGSTGVADSRFVAPGEALADLILEGAQPEVPAADDEGAAQTADEGASAALGGAAAEEGAGPSAALESAAATLSALLPKLFPFLCHGSKGVLRLVSR